jgi:zinc/manganese transport system substrate-binding protein
VNRRFLALPVLVAASALTLAGCASTSGASAAPGSSAAGGVIQVVASTNVYGDIASQIGGDLVSVTSIIDDPDKDPHEYEADAQNQLSLSKAQLVIENGGGYDDFVDTMLSAAKNDSAPVVNAADISGYDQDPAQGEFNEHLWYDFPTVQKVVDEIVANLSKIDAGNADAFAANAKTFSGKLDALEKEEADIKAASSGKGVAITEPVPLYMLTASGLVNKTPAEFSEAIEEDTDVAPDVLATTTALFADGSVSALVYNEQTTGPQTEAVLTAAKQNKVAVVPVTETMPDGNDYISWMTTNLDAIKAAVGGK